MPSRSQKLPPTSSRTHLYDVVVVGAGPGGSAAAHYLASKGLDVLLLDKSEFPRDKTCGDGLTPRALHMLADMGILEEAAQAGFRINGVELHAKAGNMMRAPVPSHPDYPNHLLIVPRMQLDDIIRRRAIRSRARFEAPVRVRGIEQRSDRAVIHADSTDKKQEIHARLIILAIGANLRMLDDLGILNRVPKMILAARAYYENMSGLNDHMQAHFANVPLPGYGWVFPISPTSANVGVGFWQSGNPFRRLPSSARIALDGFLQNPKLKEMLNGAQRVGPVKSYPLRIDFTTAPTYADRILLVGESAGLVSPLTGEGIDFALESGKLAAGFIGDLFQKGDFSLESLSAYDGLLRRHFHRLFRFLVYARRFYVNPLLMARSISVSERRSEIKRLVVNVMMSQQHPSEMFTMDVLRNVLLGV